MLSSKNLPLLLVLLLTACGGAHAPDDTARVDANLGQAAFNAGNPEVALRLTEEALAKHPNDIDALTRRGQALTELGRLDDARDTLRKAATIEPRNVPVLLALGRVQLPVDPNEAATNFELVVKQDSQNAAALNNLGIARDLLGHHVDAEAAYRAAMAAQPGMVAARVNLALCLAIRGQGNEAIGMLRPLATAADATRKIKENYATVLAMAGEREEAERILSTNLAENEVAQALDLLASAKVGTSTDTVAASGHPASVQLGALDSEAAARNEWVQLSKRFPDLLNGRQPVVSSTERDGRTFWRLRTEGFTDAVQARNFCDRLRTAGGGCAVLTT
jgi:Flp pilus assembly protein TadD